ncbi:hypothetical protein LJ655_08120 [Paraburkholderia sp. MMS20-SJTN17]|uniref:Uncharacterized protein n=1 Tax=Paraburkholderia translucens TaxID=2886945 RepID=A0ABS8KAU1_9BURK|nr:hypothetical protein [Paraburkholderia sp. MMS20-SJTN17]
MSEKRSAGGWREFVSGCLDFRPAEGVYRIARDMFTEAEMFFLQMEYVSEKTWIYACHGSEIAKRNDLLTMQRLVEAYGQPKAEWMMHRLRNLNVYPSLFFMDQISSQLRIVRPVA